MTIFFTTLMSIKLKYKARCSFNALISIAGYIRFEPSTIENCPFFSLQSGAGF
jgi:hypothetical protein